MPLINDEDGELLKTYGREEIFVDVALNESCEVDKGWIKCDREYHLRQFQKIEQKITYDELLTTDDNFLILQGIAGIGKTSLLDYLLLQWANGKIWNGTGNWPLFDFVFRFNCRDLNGYHNCDISVEDLFNWNYPNIFHSVFTETTGGLGKKVLIVVDGLDEFCQLNGLFHKPPPIGVSVKSSIATVVHTVLTKCFPNCTSIVAGRPESATRLFCSWGRGMKIKRVDVIGFSEEMIFTYVKRFISDRGKQKNIIDKLSTCTHLNAMSRVPVYLWVICSVFLADSKIPALKTTTELYVWAFLVFTKEHCRDKCFNDPSTDPRILLDDQKFQDLLKALSYLSYQMIIAKKVIFSKAELKEVYYPYDLFTEKGGFIVKTRSNNYQFRHLILQEFLCAVYCFMNKTLFAENSVDDDCFVLPIIAGLEGANLPNSISPDVVRYFVSSFMDQKQNESTVIARLADGSLSVIERNDDAFLLAPVYSDIGFMLLIACVFEFSNTVSKTIKECVAWIMQNKTFSHIRFTHSHMLDHFLHFMFQIYYTGEREILTLPEDISIKICSTGISSVQLFSLSQIISQLYSVEFIETQFCNANDGISAAAESAPKSQKLFQPKKCSIPSKELAFSGVSLNDEQTIAWCPALPVIERVDLSKKTLSASPEFQTLAMAITNAHKEGYKLHKGYTVPLKELSFSRCKLSEEQIISLSPAIPLVEKIHFQENTQLGAQGLAEVATAIIRAYERGYKQDKVYTNPLKKLNLKECQLNEEHTIALSPVIPFVTEVNLLRNTLLGTLGIEAVATAITGAHERGCKQHDGYTIPLKNLDLSECQLNEEQIIALSPAIPFVEKVNLSGNTQLSTRGLEAVVLAITSAHERGYKQVEVCTNPLKKLYLKACQLNEEHITALSPAIPFVTEVNLYGNPHLGTRGLEAVAECITSAHERGYKQGEGYTIPLKKLDLSECQLNEEQIGGFSPAIPFVAEVCLSGNRQLGTRGIEAVAECITSAHERGYRENEGYTIPLKKLDISGCQLTEEQIIAFSPAFPFVAEVNLFSNRQMGTRHLKVVAAAIISAHERGYRKNEGYSIPLKRLDLSRCDLVEEQIIALSPAIPFVAKVNLCNNTQLGTRGLEAVAVSIITAHERECKQDERCTIPLKRLDLSFCQLCEKQTIALSPAIPFVADVCLSANKLGTRGVKAIAAAVITAHERGYKQDEGYTIPLKKLSLSLCPLNEEQTIALSPAIPFVAEVCLLGNTQLGTRGLEAVAECITSAHERGYKQDEGYTIPLKKLDLSGCQLNEEQIIGFSPAIPFVAEFCLSGNRQLGTRGIEAIAEHIISAYERGYKQDEGYTIPLKKLSLSLCQLNEEQTIALSPAIPFVAEVCLSGNTQLGTQGLEAVAERITSAHERGYKHDEGYTIPLEKLDLCRCQLNKEQTIALSPAFIFVKEVDVS